MTVQFNLGLLSTIKICLFFFFFFTLFHFVYLQFSLTFNYQATRTSSYRCASVPQKYLRRFYGLPTGLQGSRKAAGNFQKTTKQMQQFFKLKVIRSASTRCSGGNCKKAGCWPELWPRISVWRQRCVQGTSHFSVQLYRWCDPVNKLSIVLFSLLNSQTISKRGGKILITGSYDSEFPPFGGVLTSMWPMCCPLRWQEVWMKKLWRWWSRPDVEFQMLESTLTSPRSLNGKIII